MAMVEKWPVVSNFPTLRTRLSDLFDVDNFLNDRMFETPLWNTRMMQVPATNIKEMDKAFMLELAAPGLQKGDFTVDVKDNLLEIKVEKEMTKNVKEDNFTRREYNFNSFCRSFTLPETINKDKIKAKYENGVLFVEMPKTPTTKSVPAKEIKVA